MTDMTTTNMTITDTTMRHDNDRHDNDGHDNNGHDNETCRLTNYELLRRLVETPSRDFAHYRLSGGRRIFTTCQELTS